jgi:hypothetical protein
MNRKIASGIRFNYFSIHLSAYRLALPVTADPLILPDPTTAEGRPDSVDREHRFCINTYFSSIFRL